MKKDSVLFIPSYIITYQHTIEFEYKTQRGNLKKRTAKFTLDHESIEYAKTYFFTSLQSFNEEHKASAYQDVKILRTDVEEKVIRDWKCLL